MITVYNQPKTPSLESISHKRLKTITRSAESTLALGEAIAYGRRSLPATHQAKSLVVGIRDLIDSNRPF